MNSGSHKVPFVPILPNTVLCFFLAVNDSKLWFTTEVGLTSFGNLSARHTKVKASHCENCDAIFCQLVSCSLLLYEGTFLCSVGSEQ